MDNETEELNKEEFRNLYSVFNTVKVIGQRRQKRQNYIEEKGDKMHPHYDIKIKEVEYF